MDLKIYPATVLRTRCKPAREIDAEFLRRADEMLEFMYRKQGIGLAGPQVGWTTRIVTLDVTGERKGNRVLVNPRIMSREDEIIEQEGCLSLPGIWVDVPRAARVRVAGYTLQGERVEMEAQGLLSRAWQHELDHLNGMLIIDRLPPASVLAIMKELRELERAAATGEERS